MILAVKMREHDFMREERRPFKGIGAVGVSAADKFVLAVGLAFQFGVTELADDLAAVALRDDVFQFHTQPHYASGLDIRCPREKICGGNFAALEMAGQCGPRMRQPGDESFLGMCYIPTLWQIRHRTGNQ
jgi:hypothetical protein